MVFYKVEEIKGNKSLKRKFWKTICVPKELGSCSIMEVFSVKSGYLVARFLADKPPKRFSNLEILYSKKKLKSLFGELVTSLYLVWLLFL